MYQPTFRIITADTTNIRIQTRVLERLGNLIGKGSSLQYSSDLIYIPEHIVSFLLKGCEVYRAYQNAREQARGQTREQERVKTRMRAREQARKQARKQVRKQTNEKMEQNERRRIW